MRRWWWLVSNTYLHKVMYSRHWFLLARTILQQTGRQTDITMYLPTYLPTTNPLTKRCSAIAKMIYLQMGHSEELVRLHFRKFDG